MSIEEKISGRKHMEKLVKFVKQYLIKITGTIMS